MAIVTIFGATFGDDEEIARKVATALGSLFVSRSILADAARRAAVPEAKLDELIEKEPRWWEGWQENLRPYRIALQLAMSEAALAENLVYFGHVGHGLLPGIRHVVRVLLIAPMEFRLEMVRRHQGLAAPAARRYIQRVDRAHSRRLMALFGSDWRDPGQYALVVNLAQVSTAAAQNMIAHAAKLRDYKATDVSRQTLADLALSSRVQAQLLTYPTLRNLPISVKASDGEITLSGVIPAISQSEIIRQVEIVPRVKKVVADFVSLYGQARRSG
jgi:cytidylate kinase